MSHSDDLAWFEQFHSTPRAEALAERPVAYFCAEFALDSGIPTYAGGLGILAGDVVREAADRHLPMVGVGLYYRQGYTCRKEGVSFVEVCEDFPPERFGLAAVEGADGSRLKIRVPIADRQVWVQAWRFDVASAADGRRAVPVYLLDTNLPENDEHDRGITGRLYVGDRETRLKQELVLGIGGLRMLEALGVHPSVYHLNEGHSAFLTLELVRHQMEERHIGFQEAKQFARRRVVFTNHTLVAAGNEVYDGDLVNLHIGRYCEQLGVPVQDVVALGLVHQSSSFSMTMLSLRMASIVNGVSMLHVEKARSVWADHPMVAVTNGVSLRTWDSLSDAAPHGQGDLWRAHQQRKQVLLDAVAKNTGRTWSVDELLIGWARRITPYKRPLSIIEDARRFGEIARMAGRPVRLLLAGQPHPSDTEGLALLTTLQTAVEHELGDVAAFMPSYRVDDAKLMVAGCDVWLNTPVVGFEASGTSGMKAALNGVLPLSARDGWVAEIELLGIGWPADSDHIGRSLLDTLEHSIVPLYYARGADGVPAAWEQNMRNARALVRERFSATRMLRQYTEVLYA